MESTRLFASTMVIAAAIIGGLYLLDRANRTDLPLPPEQATRTEFSPSSQNNSSSSGNYVQSQDEVAAETAYTDGIITCQHPDHGTVYTNAANCDEVDYDNRLTQAEPFQPIPNPDRYRDNDYQSPQEAAATNRSNDMPANRKPNLRLHGKSPPNGLNVSCKNSVGKALEIERDLAATDDPRESTWRDSYCKQRCEAIQERCPIADDYFYYRFRYMCSNSEYGYCLYRPAN